MNKWTNRFGTLLLLAATSASATGTWTTSAHAADPAQNDAGQKDFKEAMQLFDRGEIDHACSLFEQSFAETGAPGTQFNLAVCREKQGRFADAYRGFDDLATRVEQQGQADKAATARARANALIPKLARLDLMHRADARSDVTSITVDDMVLLASAYKKPIYVLPGAHAILVKHADGTDVTRKSNVLAAGAAQSIEMEDPAPLPDISLGPNAGAPLVLREETHVNNKQRTAAFVVGGVGAALAITGGVFGILAINKRTQASNACGSDCTQAGADEAYSIRHTGKVDATFSDIGIGVGLGAIAGAVLLYVTASHKETGDVPAVTPETAGSWRFVPVGDAHGAGGTVVTTF